MLFKLAIKYFKNQKRNSLTLIIAIAICTALSTVSMIICEKDIENKKNQFNQYYGGYEIIYDVPNNFYDKLKGNTKVDSTGIRKTIAAKGETDGGRYGIYYEADYGIFDNNALKNMSGINVVSGRLPEKEGEVIVLDSYASNSQNRVKVNEEYIYEGETIKDELSKEKEFNPQKYTNKVTIVGTYSAYKLNKLPTFIEYGNEEDILKYNSFKVYVKLKDGIDDRMITRLSLKFGCNLNLKNEKVVSNSSYLGLIEGKSVISSLGKTGVVVIICIFSLFVILNAFNISIIERVKQLGTLRAIGGTKLQINLILFFEGMIVEAIGIVIGILVGTLISEGAIRLLKDSFNYKITELTFANYIEIYSIVALLMLAVMLIAQYRISFGASRITPIEAMSSSTFYSNSGGLVDRDKKDKKDWVIEKKLADKNILGSYSKYIMCIITLAIGVMMCIFVGNKFIVGKVESKTKIESSNWNVEVVSKEINDEKISEIEEVNGVKKIYKSDSYKTKMNMTLDKLDSYYKQAFDETVEKGKDTRANYNLDLDEKSRSVNIVSEVIGANKELINLSDNYLVEGNIDESLLKSDKVILVNNTRFYYVNDVIMGSKTYVQIDETTKYKVGDKIKIPTKNSDNDKEYEIAAIISKNPLRDTVEVNSGDMYSSIPDIAIIMGEDNYKKQTQDEEISSIYMQVDEKNRKEIISDINNKFNDNNIQILDAIQEKELAEQRNYEYLSWDIILLGTLWIVFLLNILNTMVSIVMSRSKQIGTMRAIGMTKEQLRKNIFYEAIFLSKDILAIGMFFSIFTLLTQVKYIKEGEGVFVQFILVVLLVCLAQIIVSLISAVIAIRKSMEKTIVEEMK